MNYIELDGIRISITRKNIKNLHLRVKPPDGRVEITAPRFVGGEVISAFARSRLQWIKQRRAELEEKNRAEKAGYENGALRYLWGRPLRLRVENGARTRVTEKDGELAVSLRGGITPEKTADALKAWYREELSARIALRMPYWEELTGLRCSAWQIRDMKTRWGSCSTATGKIRINLRLAQKDPVCLDFVLVHELTHLEQPDHGARFKALMDEYMPAWREARKKLNG
ncbi:MAG: M48 family metallopeptidase [Oscillospiraceae bacterium]|nr:M48 family metallopeptidase [Oscillospiraceae bacterium]